MNIEDSPPGQTTATDVTAEPPSPRLHPSPLPPPRRINLRPEKIVMGQQGGAASVPHLSLGLAGASQPVTGLAVAKALITRISSLSLSVSDIHTHKSVHAGADLPRLDVYQGVPDCNITSTLRQVRSWTWKRREAETASIRRPY